MQNTFNQSELSTLTAQRNAALCAGDADAWHVADRQIKAIIAGRNAEWNLGLRDNPVLDWSAAEGF